MLLGAHTYFKLQPLGHPFRALGSPNTWRGTGAPVEDCYRSMDKEENNGNVVKGMGRDVGQKQKTEGKALLLHHAEIRTSQKRTDDSKGWLEERNLSYIATDLFIPSKCFHIIKWLSGLSSVRQVLRICC